MTLIEHKESATVNGQFIRNHSTVAYSQVTETGTIPASLVMESSERVAPDSVVTATINSVAAEVLPWGNTVGAGEVALDRERGLWKFNSGDVGKAVSVTYDPAGTVLTAAKLELVGEDAVTSVNSKTGAVVLDATDIENVATGESVETVLNTVVGDLVNKQDVNATLTAITTAGNGMLAKTGAGAAVSRTLTAGTGISVSNGSGVSGNPTVAVDNTVVKSGGAVFVTSGAGGDTTYNISTTDLFVSYFSGNANKCILQLPSAASVTPNKMYFIHARNVTHTTASQIKPQPGQSIYPNAAGAAVTLPTAPYTGMLIWCSEGAGWHYFKIGAW